MQKYAITIKYAEICKINFKLFQKITEENPKI
jgi:hypothetical protein